MKKISILFSTALFSILLLTGCNNDKDTQIADNPMAAIKDKKGEPIKKVEPIQKETNNETK